MKNDYGPSSSKCSKCGQRYDADETHPCPPAQQTEAGDVDVDTVIHQISELCNHAEFEISPLLQPIRQRIAVLEERLRKYENP